MLADHVGRRAAIEALVDALDLFLGSASGLRSSLGILFQLGEAGLVTKIADHVEVMI
jgi:hypothetical protein